MERSCTKRLLDILSDGQWHEHQSILEQCYEEVEEDDAFEVGEYYRTYKYVRAGRLVPESKLGRDATICTGKRVLVARSITKLKNRARVEIETEPQGRKGRRHKPIRIRLRLE